jgi:Rieske Fe-S protein
MSPRESEEEGIGPDGRPLTEQPAWRQDFPIDWPQDHYVARRDFTKFLGLTSLAFAVGQVWIFVQSWLKRRHEEHATMPIARVNEIPVGSARVFHYPGEDDPCLLLRPSEDTFLAYDQKCTHLSCAVLPEPQGGRLRCPCHHGYFDTATGRPLAGPPRRPLPRILLVVQDGVLYAIGMERATV